MNRFLSLLSLLLFPLCCLAQNFKAELRSTIENINCMSLCESPDGTYALSNKRFGIGIQIIKRNKDSYELKSEISTGNNKFPQKICIGDKGNVFVVAFSDRSLKVYKRTGSFEFEEQQFLSDLEEIPQFMIYNEARKLFVMADHSNTWFYELRDDKIKQVATLAFGGFIQISENGNTLYSSDKIYDIAKLQEPKVLFDFETLKYKRFSSSSIDATALSSGGMYYAMDDDRKLVICKRSGNGYVLSDELELAEELEYMVFSNDGKYLVGGEDNSDRTKIFVWKISDAGKLELTATLKDFQDGIEKMVFSVDGKFLLCGTSDVFYCYAIDGVKGSAIVLQDKKITPPKKVTAEPVVVKDKPAVQPAQVINNINIFWINPNPDVLNDKPINTDKPVIEIQVKIISNEVVKKEEIKILINGKELQKNKFNEVSLIPAKPAPGEKADEYTFVKNIPLENGLNKIEISTKGKKTSKAVNVYYSAGKPSLHILSIGTSLDLQYPKKDAEDFATLFSKQQGKDKLFEKVDVKKLIGKEATTNAIKEAIEFYKYEYKQGSILPSDVLLIFISSHGFIYQNKFRIQGDDYKDIYKETYSVAYDEIISRLNEIDCKKIIFLDACFSGGAKASPVEINEAIDQLNKQKTGTTTFSSCSNDEYSYEDPVWNNGAFTRAIVDGLTTGAADKNKNGMITIEELYEYTKISVPKMVSDVKNKSQHPTMPISDLIKETTIFVVE